MKAGDIVRIKSDGAENLFQPYRDWAEKGRAGTVVSVWDNDGSPVATIQFHTRRPAKRPTDYCERFSVLDLEVVPAESAWDQSAAIKGDG